MSEFRPEEQNFDIGDKAVAVIVARWNSQITEGLLQGALKELERNNVANYKVIRVPGAFELPIAAKRVAQTGKYDAIVTLGCVIRGDTPHFDYVCSETARGVGEVALTESLPVAFGVLTTDDLAQSLARSGDDEENKGIEAVAAALELLVTFEDL